MYLQLLLFINLSQYLITEYIDKGLLLTWHPKSKDMTLKYWRNLTFLWVHLNRSKTNYMGEGGGGELEKKTRPITKYDTTANFPKQITIEQ